MAELGRGMARILLKQVATFCETSKLQWFYVYWQTDKLVVSDNPKIFFDLKQFNISKYSFLCYCFNIIVSILYNL